jgi:hypothetical protein
MIINESKDNLVLRRYAGVLDGKSLDTRIGSIPRDTSPNAIPAEILDDLTPKELRQLQEKLTSVQKEILKSKAFVLVSEMNDIASALESGLLGTESMAELHKAASMLAKRARTVTPRGSSTSPDSEPS